MKYITKIFFVPAVILFLALCGNVAGQKFMQIGSGAKAIGLAEAYVSVTDDLNAMNYNPASLGFLNESRISLMHIEWIDDIMYEYIAYCKPMAIGTFGVNVKFLHYPQFDYIDKQGDAQGKIGGEDLAVTVGLGKKMAFLKNNFAGINLKFVRTRLADYSAMSAVLDIGINGDLLIFNGRKMKTGIALRNFGFNFKKAGEKTMALPIEVAFGGNAKLFEMKVHRVNGMFETVYDSKTLPKLRLGVEYSFNNFIFGRLGYKLGYSTSSFGGGIGVGRALNNVRVAGRYNIESLDVSLDYAIVPYGNLGINHYITLNIRNLKITKSTAPKEPEKPETTTRTPEIIPTKQSAEPSNMMAPTAPALQTEQKTNTAPIIEQPPSTATNAEDIDEDLDRILEKK